MRRPEVNLQESVLPFHHVCGPLLGTEVQVARLGSKHLYSPGHPAGLTMKEGKEVNYLNYDHTAVMEMPLGEDSA